MAKFARLDEWEEPGHTTARPKYANFWEHWFQAQPSNYPPSQPLDEHTVWEKAVYFGILGARKAKG